MLQTKPIEKNEAECNLITTLLEFTSKLKHPKRLKLYKSTLKYPNQRLSVQIDECKRTQNVDLG